MIRAVAGVLDRAINPIALKELRQAVRGRFVAAIVVFCLTAFMVAMCGFAITQSLTSITAERAALGAGAFITLFMVLFTVCLFLIPLYTGVRMMAERSDTNVDLLFITSLRPRTIIFGKLQSAAALTGLVFCAAMPFFMFCYVLRGIDVLSIFLFSAIGYFLIVSQSILALFVGSLPASKPFKLLLAITLIGVTLLIYSPMMLLAGVVLRSGGMTMMFDPTVRRTVLPLFAGMVMLDILLLFASTTLITPHTANRAFPIRVLLAVIWPITLAAATFGAFGTMSLVPLTLWAIAQLAVMTLVLCSAIGEREAWGKRVARSIPRSAFLRAVAFAFYSGGGGVLFALAGMAATLLAFAMVGPNVPAIAKVGRAEHLARWLFEGAVCVAAYAFSGLLVRRKLLARRIAPKTTWAVALVLFILGAIVPPLVCLALDADRVDFGRYMQIATAANPFPITAYAGDRNLRLAFLELWLFVVVAANAPWLREMFSRFRNPADLEAT